MQKEKAERETTEELLHKCELIPCSLMTRNKE